MSHSKTPQTVKTYTYLTSDDLYPCLEFIADAPGGSDRRFYSFWRSSYKHQKTKYELWECELVPVKKVEESKNTIPLKQEDG